MYSEKKIHFTKLRQSYKAVTCLVFSLDQHDEHGGVHTGFNEFGVCGHTYMLCEEKNSFVVAASSSCCHGTCVHEGQDEVVAVLANWYLLFVDLGLILNQGYK